MELEEGPGEHFPGGEQVVNVGDVVAGAGVAGAGGGERVQSNWRGGPEVLA